jgi:tetratricopeptide (TPR) repeat protein
MDFWANNKDAIETIATVIGALIAVGGVILGAWKFWRANRIRGEIKVFELITNPAALLPKLYGTENDNSPLADHNIKYQPRDPKRDLQTELKTALNRSRYLLITAPTGYGKTREGGMLAQAMMLEGWRVLRIRPGWLDVPKALPEELNGSRSRVLIFLDDLNGLFSTGNLTQSPRVENEKALMLNQLSYHDRLLQVLDMFEGMCTESEIRVIATARSEAEQWKVLEYSQSDRLWRRFERVELSEPMDSVIVNLLEDTTKEAGIKGDENDFMAIAHKSDGTYRNILLNLRRWHAQNKEVSKNDFTETLDGSWRDIYERAVRKYPESKFIYISIFLLQQYQIPLYTYLVKPLARRIAYHNMFTRLLHGHLVDKSLQYLIQHENILSPRDDQIESCPVIRDILPIKYLQQIYELFILPGFFHSKQLETSILQTFFSTLSKIKPKITENNLLPLYFALVLSLHFPFEMIATYLFRKGHDKKAINLLKNRQTQNALTIGFLSSFYSKHGEIEKSISLLEKSISSTHQNSTVLYIELAEKYRTMGQNDEAEATYRKAIELNPSYATAYSNFGNLLVDLNRYEEAEAAYRKAIELNPSDANAYSNFGNLLVDLNRYEEAEAAYRKAIELNPSDANAYSSLGILLKNLKRYDEAEAAYRKAIELNPSDTNAYLGIASIKKTLGKPIESSFIEKARQYIPGDDFYNKACLESVCDQVDMAFEYLQKASQKEKFNPKWAWEDPDLEWIRRDPRFIKIVGARPQG